MIIADDTSPVRYVSVAGIAHIADYHSSGYFVAVAAAAGIF